MIYINKVISDTMSERPVRLKSYKIYAISHELEENAHKYAFIKDHKKYIIQ